MQRLRQDETVELIRWNVVGRSEVRHDGCVWIRGIDVDDLTIAYRGTEPVGVRVIFYLEHAAPDVIVTFAEEALDVVAIDRRAAIESPRPAQRRRTTERSEKSWTKGPSDPSLCCCRQEVSRNLHVGSVIRSAPSIRKRFPIWHLATSRFPLVSAASVAVSLMRRAPGLGRSTIGSASTRRTRLAAVPTVHKTRPCRTRTKAGSPCGGRHPAGRGTQS